MFKRSVWKTYSSEAKYPSLKENLNVEVAIIGGGITGISTAKILNEHGIKVALLEARSIGKGSTGQSTGNLYVITDQLLHSLKDKYDQELIKKVVESRKFAIDKIKANISNNDLDCDYKIQPMYLFQSDGSSIIEAERESCNEIGLAFSSINAETFPFELQDGMKFTAQAQFNPLLYVQNLAQTIDSNEVRIYENTPVREVEENDDGIKVYCDGATVDAKYVVYATHSPKGVNVQYDTVLGPYREYGVAVKLKGEDYPEGIYWGYISGNKYSIRNYKRKEENYLICVGQPHKVGQADNNQLHIDGLKRFIQKRFEIDEITNLWGGQNYKPADLLPYIGRKSGGSNQFIATGFSTDGLVYGTLAASIISDEILGNENRYAGIYKASRHQPAKAGKKFIKENFNIAKKFIEDLPVFMKEKGIDLAAGEGSVIKKDGKRIAVYKDEEGILKINTAVCPHLGCVVHWNNAEKTWDCPCHGSRFDVCGQVIEGPSFEGLDEINLEE